MLIREVERTLQGYDPLLRIRYSKERERWSVERKVTRGRFADNPHHYESDRYYHVRDGYIPVGYLPPRSEFFSGEVEGILQSLYEGDLYRVGGAEKMSDKLDLEYEREQERIDRDIRSENEALAGESYEDLAWLDKRRIVSGIDLKS